MCNPSDDKSRRYAICRHCLHATLGLPSASASSNGVPHTRLSTDEEVQSALPSTSISLHSTTELLKKSGASILCQMRSLMRNVSALQKANTVHILFLEVSYPLEQQRRKGDCCATCNCTCTAVSSGGVQLLYLYGLPSTTHAFRENIRPRKPLEPRAVPAAALNSHE